MRAEHVLYRCSGWPREEQETRKARALVRKMCCRFETARLPIFGTHTFHIDGSACLVLQQNADDGFETGRIAVIRMHDALFVIQDMRVVDHQACENVNRHTIECGALPVRYYPGC